MPRFLSTALILCLAAPAWAAAPERLGTELSVGDSPSQTTVLAGDRVAAALVGETRVIAWRDAADYTEEPALIAPTGEARALTAAGSSDAPVLVIAGSALELLTFDTTTVPATSSSTASISLEGDEGSLAAVVWSSNHDTVYAIDDAVPRLHAFGLIDETALTPVELDFTPTGLALVDSELIVVIGADQAGPRLMGIALDGTGVPGDTTDVDLTGLIDTSVEAIAADGAGTGWLIATNDAYHLFVEMVRDDTDRSAPRGCAPVDGTANGFAFRTLSCELAAGAATLAYGVRTDDEAEAEPGVYIGGGGFLSYVDVSGGSTYDIQSLDLMLTGTSGDIALSSSTDSYLYVAQPETGLLGVVVPGPWLDLDAPDTNLSGDADTLTFSITPTLESLESCSFTVYQGGDFTGTGVVIESGSGVAPSGDATEVSIPALDLEDGSSRLFILCGDDDGVFGRASLSYYKGGLEAPEITALPGSENVVVSFDGLDDHAITHYLVYFDTWDFGATGTAAGVNSTSTISSPIQLDSDSGTVATGDDDDSADDGAEGRDDTATLTYSTSITDLVNETPYYFAVSAVDSDGNEGPRSTVVEARPGVTGGAAALASDTYGCSCQTVDSGATPVGLAALFALLGLGRYRRRMDPLYR